MIEALLWGTVAGSSFVLGGLIELRSLLPSRWIGVLLGVGAGALISAVTFELVSDSAALGAGTGRVGAGLTLGALASYFTGRALGRERSEPSNRPLVVAAVLDVVSESLVIVGSLLIGGGLSAAVITAVFLCGVAEAITWTEKLTRQGLRAMSVERFWVILMVVCGAVATVGYGVLRSAPDTAFALVLAFAGGYLLATVTTEVIPEANERGGHLAGLATVMGFGLSFALVALAH